MKSIFRNIGQSNFPFEFINKTHPNENTELNHQLSRIESNGKAKIINDKDIFEMIYISDVWITVTSTTAIEASIMGKPVILLDFPGIHNAYSGYFKISRIDELHTEIKRILENPEYNLELDNNRAKFVQELAFKQDGLSSVRVSNLVQKIVKNV